MLMLCNEEEGEGGGEKCQAKSIYYIFESYLAVQNILHDVV